MATSSVSAASASSPTRPVAPRAAATAAVRSKVSSRCGRRGNQAALDPIQSARLTMPMSQWRAARRPPYVRENGQRRWSPAGRECRDETAYEVQWIALVPRQWAKAVSEAAKRDELRPRARLAVVAEHRSHQRSVGGILDISERQETSPQVGQCRTPFVKEKRTGLVGVVSPLEPSCFGQRHRPVFAALEGPGSLAEVVKADKAYQCLDQCFVIAENPGSPPRKGPRTRAANTAATSQPWSSSESHWKRASSGASRFVLAQPQNLARSDCTA